MRTLKQLFAILSMLTAAVSAGAASLPTNYYQNVTLHFSVVAPGHSVNNGLGATVSNVNVTTPMIIQILGQVTSNSFSSKAKLFAVGAIAYYTNAIVTTNGSKLTTNNYVYGYPGNPSFVVIDGANQVDVSSLSSIATVNTNIIASSLQNKTGGYAAYESFRVRALSFSNAIETFTGQGFVATPLHNVTVAPKVVVVGYDDHWSSFTGVASGSLLNGVLQGTLMANYDHVK